MTKEASNTNALKKEMWLHACAVVSNEKLPGLRSMVFSCYYYEKMMAEELGKKDIKDIDSWKLHSLFRAWVCVFFEVLRVICEKKYKKHASPCVLDRMRQLEDIKREVVDFRSFLSKLKEDKFQHKGKDKELSTTPFCPYSLESYVLAEEMKEMIRDVNIQEQSEKFLSILSECEVPESSKRWLSKIKKNT